MRTILQDKSKIQKVQLKGQKSQNFESGATQYSAKIKVIQLNLFHVD